MRTSALPNFVNVYQVGNLIKEHTILSDILDFNFVIWVVEYLLFILDELCCEELEVKSFRGYAFSNQSWTLGMYKLASDLSNNNLLYQQTKPRNHPHPHILEGNLQNGWTVSNTILVSQYNHLKFFCTLSVIIQELFYFK